MGLVAAERAQGYTRNFGYLHIGGVSERLDKYVPVSLMIWYVKANACIDCSVKPLDLELRRWAERHRRSMCSFKIATNGSQEFSSKSRAVICKQVGRDSKPDCQMIKGVCNLCFVAVFDVAIARISFEIRSVNIRTYWQSCNSLAGGRECSLRWSWGDWRLIKIHWSHVAVPGTASSTICAMCASLKKDFCHDWVAINALSRIVRLASARMSSDWRVRKGARYVAINVTNDTNICVASSTGDSRISGPF